MQVGSAALLKSTVGISKQEGKVVGASGFEPPTSWSRIVTAHLDRLAIQSDTEDMESTEANRLGKGDLLCVPIHHT